MKKVIVWLRCSDCGEEFTSPAMVSKDDGVDIYPDNPDCANCGGTGEIIDTEDVRVSAADNFYSSMVEERLIG
jgi:uncharacterized OB-fold protein